MKNALRFIIHVTWGIIQSLLGFCLFIRYRKCRHRLYNGVIMTYHDGNWGGVSLGCFIFVNGNRDEKWLKNTEIHEFGHTIQSLILGPLYLLVIGIPSSVWCNAKKYRKLREEKNVSYYTFYPERWANYCGQKATKQKMTDI